MVPKPFQAGTPLASWWILRFPPPSHPIPPTLIHTCQQTIFIFILVCFKLKTARLNIKMYFTNKTKFSKPIYLAVLAVSAILKGKSKSHKKPEKHNLFSTQLLLMGWMCLLQGYQLRNIGLELTKKVVAQ